MSTAVWPPLYTQGNITLPADATLLQSTEQWTTIEKYAFRNSFRVGKGVNSFFFCPPTFRFAIAFGVSIYTLTVLATSVLNIYRQVPYVKVQARTFSVLLKQVSVFSPPLLPFLLCLFQLHDQIVGLAFVNIIVVNSILFWYVFSGWFFFHVFDPVFSLWSGSPC